MVLFTVSRVALMERPAQQFSPARQIQRSAQRNHDRRVLPAGGLPAA